MSQGANTGSCGAADAAICAGEQGRFWEFQRALFFAGSPVDGLDRIAKETALDVSAWRWSRFSRAACALVENDIEDGLQAGVKGTPTFIIGKRVVTVARSCVLRSFARNWLLPVAATAVYWPVRSPRLQLQGSVLRATEKTMSNVEYEVAKLAFENHEYTKALRYLQPLATLGHPKAQHLLGFMYAEGLGVPRDEDAAARWFAQAAEQGLQEAQVELGALCTLAKGVPKDQAEAVRWFRLAAENGVKEAQVALGFKYARGQGVPHDDARALEWFRQAADQGSNEASAALGFMYTDGRGVPQSDAEAVKWFRRAADRGLKVAQAALGFMYSSGRGVARDYVQAHMWLCVSDIVEQGEVRKQLAAIENKMSSEQLAKAEQLAQEWKPRQ